MSLAISIITVNWNRYAETARLLTNLRTLDSETGSRSCEVNILLVDSASRDGSSQRLAADFPEVTLIESAHNRGYAAAVNLGIERALTDDADYIWLLNNDTIVAADALVHLVQTAQKLARPAILSPLILYLDEPERIWFAGGALDERLKSTHIGQDEADSPHFAGLQRVDWVSGCAPFFSREVAETVGSWSTDYFLYLEDVDWCLKAREQGIGCYLVGASRIWHEISRSTEELGSALLRYYAWRNYYLLGRRRGKGLARVRVETDLWWSLIKSGARWLLFPSYRNDQIYHARTHGLIDLLQGHVGRGEWPQRVGL